MTDKTTARVNYIYSILIKRGWVDYDLVLNSSRAKMSCQVALKRGDIFSNGLYSIFVSQVYQNHIEVLAGSPAEPKSIKLVNLSPQNLKDLVMPNDVLDLCFWEGAPSIIDSLKQMINEAS